ncbi:MAG: MucR family transcriptional regulator [Magnetospiraceae bacterium]
MSDEIAESIDRDDLLRMTVEIVAAHVSRNELPAEALSEVITTVYSSLSSVAQGQEEEKSEPQKPAVPIKKSITPDYLICLEDGKKLKMLKRHLRTNYEMTPEEYRAKWNLPSDYPMVAPNYAQQRSEFAKKIGLGTKPAAKKKTTRRRKAAAK